MKNKLITVLFLSLSFISFSQVVNDSTSILSEDTTMYELVDGTRITKAKLDSIFQKAWDNSFGKISKEDENILREKFVSDYARKKGWDKSNLTPTQMLEIVQQKGYKNPGLILS